MQKKLFYYFLCVNILFIAGFVFTNGFPSIADTVIRKLAFIFILLLYGALPILFISGVLVVLHIIVSFIGRSLAPQISFKLPRLSKPTVIKPRLVRLILSEEEEENIIGDLHEEFIAIRAESKVKAYIWLYEQVIRSVFPLAYKNVRNRLASYFGERIR